MRRLVGTGGQPAVQKGNKKGKLVSWQTQNMLKQRLLSLTVQNMQVLPRCSIYWACRGQIGVALGGPACVHPTCRALVRWMESH